MKKLFISIIAAVAIIAAACALKVIADPICDRVEGYSFICETSRNNDIEPEHVYGWIFSASAVAAIIEPEAQELLCEFSAELGDWYVRLFPVSYESVLVEIAAMLKNLDNRQVKLLKSILNANLDIYSSPLIITPADDFIMRAGNNKFQADMFCE